MSPALRAYLVYAMTNSRRVDFLRVLEEAPSAAALEKIARMPHNVWETAIWLQVTGRKLVRRADGHYRILPAAEVRPDDAPLPNELRPCRVEVDDDGLFRFKLTDGPSNFTIYDRGDPAKNEAALREALPAQYLSFRPSARSPGFSRNSGAAPSGIPAEAGLRAPGRSRTDEANRTAGIVGADPSWRWV